MLRTSEIGQTYRLRMLSEGPRVRVWRSVAGQAPELLFDITTRVLGTTELRLVSLTSTTAVDDVRVLGDSLDTTVGHAYDALGRRIGKRIQNSSGADYALRYTYDGWRLAECGMADGAVLTDYAYGNGLDELLHTHWYMFDSDFYALQDDQGSVLALTNASGTVVERYGYGPGGEPTAYTAQGQAQSGLTSAQLFAGSLYDPETGLYYQRYRYYDPEAGRFLTRDPLGAWADPSALGNPFAYCGNSPWDTVDPWGLRPGYGSGIDGLLDGGLNAYIPGHALGSASLNGDFANGTGVALAGVGAGLDQLWRGTAYTAYRYARGLQFMSDLANPLSGLLSNSGADPAMNWLRGQSDPCDPYIRKTEAGLFLFSDTPLMLAGALELSFGAASLYENWALARAAQTASTVPEAASNLAARVNGRLPGYASTFGESNLGNSLVVPRVMDPKLANIVNDLYKGAKGPNPIGTGSTADAVRSELITGQPTFGRFHSTKAQEYINGLRNWLRGRPNASHHDRLVAQSLLDDMVSALSGN